MSAPTSDTLCYLFLAASGPVTVTGRQLLWLLETSLMGRLTPNGQLPEAAKIGSRVGVPIIRALKAVN